MATKSTNAKQDAAGRRVAKKGEPALALYADKVVTPVIEDFSEWLTAQTGYEVDPMSVFLGSALRSTFQKSEQNQERIAASAQAKLDAIAAREERAEAREAARAEKEAAKAAKAAEPKAPKAAPAKKAPAAAAKAPAKKAAAAPAPVRRRPIAAAGKKSTKSDF